MVRLNVKETNKPEQQTQSQKQRQQTQQHASTTPDTTTNSNATQVTTTPATTTTTPVAQQQQQQQQQTEIHANAQRNLSGDNSNNNTNSNCNNSNPTENISINNNNNSNNNNNNNNSNRPQQNSTRIANVLNSNLNVNASPFNRPSTASSVAAAAAAAAATATSATTPQQPATITTTPELLATWAKNTGGGIVMVVPHLQHQQQPPSATQPQTQYVASPQQQQQQQQHMHAHQQQSQQQQSQQQQHSPSDGSQTASPPLLPQAPTPPQGAQMGPPICALHHPQQHQQQQMALVAMHQAHLAGGTPMGPPPPPPHAIHAAHAHAHAMSQHAVGPPPHTLSPQGGSVSPQQQQHSQQQHLVENGHVSGGGSSGAGMSPSGGSTASSIGSNSSLNSSSGVGGGGSSVGSGTPATVMAAPPHPPHGPPAPLFIPYPSDFYPTEYYIAPHPHEGICPQHPHHHQTLCAMPTDYGPPTVQMVSQNRPPPMPVPVQVPQGQVMQPYVNESGPLTHVVQLQQYQGHLHAPFINGTSHFYQHLPAGFPPGPGGGPTHYHAMSAATPGGHLPPQPPSATAQQQQHLTQQNAPSQQQQQTPPMQPNLTHSPHSPSPPSSYHKDERSQRQHTKLLRKLEKQRELNSAMSTPAHSPSPRRLDINGHHNHGSSVLHSSNNNGTPIHHANHNNHHMPHHHQMQQAQPHLNNNHGYGRRTAQRNGGHGGGMVQHTSGSSGGGGASSVGTSEDGEDTSSVAEDEEDFQTAIVEQLSAIQKPEVIDITSRSAKIIWDAPAITDSMLINMRELRYNVLLSDRAKECKYKSLYKGESYDCIVQDLQPGQEYVVRLQVHYEKLQGTPSEPTEFTTPACEPDQPLPPKLTERTKNSLHLSWLKPQSNGSAIQYFLIEHDDGKTGNRQQQQITFVKTVKTKGKHYQFMKLQPSTVYNFRLAAVNEVGPSPFSIVSSYSTSGNPPPVPKAPALQAVSSNSLRLMWERRQPDNDFTLQMLDHETGHGYINVYNGPDCIYECCQLRRATVYQFRLRSQNEAGCSAWSTEVSYKTAPERPGRPGKPHAKGKIHGNHFRVRWEPPTDNGGADIIHYFLEITSGSNFERIYAGPEPETTCDRLQPGTTYQLRASCEGPAGLSSYSEVAHITSEAIVPAAPPPPYYDNPPGPFAAVLRLDKPEYNGGAPMLEFEVQLRRAVSSNNKNSDINNSTIEQQPIMVYRGKDAYCVVKDLRPGHDYEVQVRAINRIGAGAWSSWFQFAAAAAPPNQPEAPKVVVKSATHLLVNWKEPESNGAAISEYRLESAAIPSAQLTTQNNTHSTDANTNNIPPASTAFQMCYQGAQTNADLRNLSPYTIYYFRLNACNVSGVSKWSPLVNAKTPAAVPGAPQMKDYEFTASEVTLRWSQPECNGAPITAYNIEYTGDNVITTSDGDTTEYTINDLTPETQYKFRVQAVNEVGVGPFSTYAKLTTLPPPPKPPTLECTGAGHNFIKLKWGDGKNLDFTKFYVEMYVQRAKEFQVVYSGTSCMCKVNKLQERTAYTFRVCAGNDRAGVGDYSDEYVFNTTASLPNSIKAPRVAHEGSVCIMGTHGTTNATNTNTNLIPSGMLPETPTSFIAGFGNLSLCVPLTLEWQSSKNTFNDRVEYQLQYAVGKDADFKRIYRGSETKFTIENLEPGATYQFRVCPIRVTSQGEDFPGAYSSTFRYQVPALLDELDGNSLRNAAANVFSAAAAAAASASGTCGGGSFGTCNNSNNSNNNSNNNSSNSNTTCHGHSHHHSHHVHHAHNHTHHSHHNSRHSNTNNNNNNNNHNTGSSSSNASLHHRSVSASAATTSSSSSSSLTSMLTTHNGSSSNNNNTNNNTNTNTNSSNNGNSNSLMGGNSLFFNSNAIGLLPLGATLNNEGMPSNFNSCDDPNHHHHHHHHHHGQQCRVAGGLAMGSDGESMTANVPSAATFLAANGLLQGNPQLLLNAAAASLHHQHHHHNHAAQNNGAIKRFVTKLTSMYTNRKRFTDQEKAVLFMVSFLFFTFLFATLVKMFMR